MLNMALPSFPCVGSLEYISIPLKDYKEITREGEGVPEKAFVQVIDGQFAKSYADTS